MPTSEFRLSQSPDDPRQRELWLQHAMGFILIEDVRNYALQQLDPSLGEDAREAATKAINDALYGMAMVMDGVTGALQNEKQQVNLRLAVDLVDRQNGKVIESLDLSDGDGVCMGYHGWIDGDYGGVPPFEKKSAS